MQSVSQSKEVCFIIGAGDFSSATPLPFKENKTNALIIAADGGYDYLAKQCIVPDIIIGDFDSIQSETQINAGEIIRLPKEKDDTDMLAAVKCGLAHNCSVFHICGAFGGRKEHSIANLQVLAFLARKGKKTFLYDETSIITAIAGESHICFSPECSGYISVFAYGGKAEGVDIKGLKYEIENATLFDDFPIGVSNEFIGDNSYISLKEGTLFVVSSYFPLTLETNNQD